MSSEMEPWSKLNKRLRDPEDSSVGISRKRSHHMITRSRKTFMDAQTISVTAQTLVTVKTVCKDEIYEEDNGEYESEYDPNEESGMESRTDVEPEDDSWKTFDFEEVYRSIVYMSGYSRSDQTYYREATTAQLRGFVEYFANVVRTKLNILRPSVLDPLAPPDNTYIDPAYCIYEWHSNGHNPSKATDESRNRGEEIGEELFRHAMRYTINAQILLAMIEWLEMKMMELRRTRHCGEYFNANDKASQAKNFHFFGAAKYALADFHVRQSQFESAALQEVAGLDPDYEEESDSD